MRVLVTGAAGFLGAHIVDDLLIHGHTVRVLCHATMPGDERLGRDVVCGDVRDPQTAKHAVDGCSAIVHFAGKAHAVDERQGDERAYDSVNVQGTGHLLEAAAAANVRSFIFASTVKVFGEKTDHCVDESLCPAPQGPYANSKWAAEQLVQSYAKRYRFRGVSLRLPLVYGPTQKGNLFRMISAIDRRRFPPLPKLTSVRSMLHVKNCAQAVRRVLEAERPLAPCYIVTDAHPYNVTRIYELLCAGLGRRAPAQRLPLWLLKAGATVGDIVQLFLRQGVPFTTTNLCKLIEAAWYSPQAIIRDLGYHPALSFEEAVPELVAFYRKVAA